MNNIKYDYTFVHNYFTQHNCELLSTEYVNNKSKLRYRCICGNESETSFSNFKNKNVRCRKCSGYEKYTYEKVLEIFAKKNCILLSNKYIDCFDKLTFKCHCGNISETTLNNFKQQKGCMKCSGAERLSYEYVKAFFEKQNYTLLSKEYKNTMTKLHFKCDNGHINHMEFMSFQKGHRCSMCCFKTERIVLEFLNAEYSNVIYQAKFDWCKNKAHLPFDFLLKDHKLLIELDGMQHFQHFRTSWKTPKEIQENDKFKMRVALQKKYSIIRISQEDVFDNNINWKHLLKYHIKSYDSPKVIYISKDDDLYKNHIL